VQIAVPITRVNYDTNYDANYDADYDVDYDTNYDTNYSVNSYCSEVNALIVWKLMLR
jgi:hypothetical protein